MPSSLAKARASCHILILNRQLKICKEKLLIYINYRLYLNSDLQIHPLSEVAASGSLKQQQRPVRNRKLDKNEVLDKLIT